MSWIPSKAFIWTIFVSLALVGCSPNQPMYLRDSGDMSYYLEKATDIEYPDVETVDLEEVTQALPPITVLDPDFDAFLDFSLEQCVSMALQNAKVLRGYGTPNLQQNRVSPGLDQLANGPAAAGTVYDVAIRESEPGFIGTPGQISGPGSILTNTGLDVNQGVESALADFDAQFTTSAFWTKSDEPRNVDPTIVNNPGVNPFDRLIFQQDQVQWQSEIAKKTANGTQLFFRNVNVWTENNTPLVSDNGFQNLDSWYRTSVEFEVRQPLLRGRGAFIQRMPIVISRIGTDQLLANFESQLQNMVTNIEIRYWDLYCAYRNMEASKTGRDAALETWRILKAQFSEGADVNKQQVAQSGEQYHFFNAQVYEAANNVFLAEGALRWLMGLSATDGYLIRPIDEAIMAPIEFDFNSARCEALTFRPELRQQLWEIKKKCLAVGYSKNSLLPELNFTGLYRVLGLGNFYATSQDSPQNFADQTSGAWNDVFGGQFQEVQGNIEFRMPIGFRRELSNVRNAELKLARELARTEDMKLDITREVTEALRAVAVNRMLMQSAFNRWKETSIEKDHFDELEQAGLETLDVALDAQRRNSQAEIAFYTSLCEYNKSLAITHRRKGTILAYNNICMAEGPWPGKAYDDAAENARRRSAGTPMNYGWTRPQVVSQGPQWPAMGDGQVISNSPQARPINDPYMDPYGGQAVPFDSNQQYDPGYLSAPETINSPNGMPIESIPTPAIQGSSSRNEIPNRNVRQRSIRQVSHEEPSVAPTAHPARIIPMTKAAHENRQLTRIQADTQPAKRLPKPATNVPPVAPKQLQTRKTSLDWEKFGLTRPSGDNGSTRARIKQGN